MMEENPNAGKQHMVKIHYRKDGQPIRRVMPDGKPVKKVRMSKKERRRMKINGPMGIVEK